MDRHTDAAEATPPALRHHAIGPTLPPSLWYAGLGLITAVAAFLRLWQLGSYPQLFNQDEMVLGYDGWSIWTTAHDQWDKLLPVYFRTFNDYVPPVGNYLVAPFVGLFGLTSAMTRLPFALLGVATVVLAGLLGAALFGRVAGLVAAALLTFEPWHINYSRIAFPASTVPFLTVLAVYTFVRGVRALDGGPRRGAMAWLVGSGISFGLLGMAYPTQKIDAPLLLLVCLLAAFGTLRRNPRHLAALVIAAGFVAAPAIIAQLTDWANVQGRFNGVSIFDNEAEWWLAIPRNYVSHFDFSRLFFFGFKDGIAVEPDNVGELLWVEGIGGVAALYTLAHGRRLGGLNVTLLLFGWFLTFPVAGSLTISAPHEIRTINFLPLPEILAGYGVVLLWQALGRLRFAAVRPATFGILGLITAFNIWLVLAAFFPVKDAVLTQTAKDIPVNIGFAPIAQDAARRLQPCDTLFMSLIPQPQMYYIFSTQYPPARYQQTPKVVTDASDGFTRFQSLGQILFHDPNVGQLHADPKTLTGCTAATPGHSYWLVHYQPNATEVQGKTGATWRTLSTFADTHGEPLWSLLELNGS